MLVLFIVKGFGLVIRSVHVSFVQQSARGLRDHPHLGYVGRVAGHHDGGV